MRRLIELDAVRGLAAVAIMVFHLNNRLLPTGWMAVDLFMLLSGYLIMCIIFKNGGSRHFLPIFYLRRALRLWPTYYLALLAVFLLPLLIHKPLRESFPYYLTFTQNVPYYWSETVPRAPAFFFHTWSLAVEEQYYLIWPVLLVVFGRRWLVPLALATIVGCACARGAGMHFSLLISRCDGFALGAILAFLLDGRELDARARRGYGLGFGVLGLAASGVAWGLTHNAFALTTAWAPAFADSFWMLAVIVVFFCMIGLVIVFADHPRLKLLRHPVPCYLGRVSYGLYLYHPIVYVLLDRIGAALGFTHPWGLGFAKLTISLLAAALSWRFVERPLHDLRNYLPYSKAFALSRPLPEGLGLGRAKPSPAV